LGIIGDGAVVVAFCAIGKSTIIVGERVLGIEPDCLVVVGDGAVVVPLGGGCETAGECVFWIEPDRLPGDNAIEFAFEDVFYVLASGHLGIGGSKALFQFAFADERAGRGKCILQVRRAAQRGIEECIAEISPGVSVFATERGVIGVCRSDYQRV